MWGDRAAERVRGRSVGGDMVSGEDVTVGFDGMLGARSSFALGLVRWTKEL